MSYYDHATMMAFMLGPWANNHGGEMTRAEAPPDRPPVLKKKRAFGPIARLLRLIRSGPNRRTPDAAQNPVLNANSDGPGKT